MTPHLNSIGIRIGVHFYYRHGIENINGVIRIPICAPGNSFGIVEAAIIRSKYNVAVSCKSVDIVYVTFRCAVFIRRDVTMVENYHRSAAFGLLLKRYSQQGIDLQSFRSVRCYIAVVIHTRFKRLFDHDLASWVLLLL
jgi:hypothetical protein